MYTIGHKYLKLDGIITEFCDIYAPIAQMFRNEEEMEKEYLKKSNERD